MNRSETRKGRDFIARHGETVFNVVKRLQGTHPHTPLTRAGFAQAEEMGRALRVELGVKPKLELWASPTGRALQTLAVIAEHLELDWHGAQTDERLTEIDMGDWGGRYYAEIFAEAGNFIDADTGLFAVAAPQGEFYDGIAARVSDWAGDTNRDGDRLIIMHGMSSRVLRGVLIGAEMLPKFRAPVAGGLPQGTVVAIESGVERVVHRGTGYAPA